MANLFPMFLKLEGRNCLVVGAGKVGEPKIASLIGTGARIKVVSSGATERVEGWHRDGQIVLEKRPFATTDLEGIFLVIAATNSPKSNGFVFREAKRRGVLCNVVDDPVRCDFFYPAVVRRGRLQIAISTAGLSPALAQRLRRELESQFSEEYEVWLEELGEYRRRLFATGIAAQARRQLLHLAASREGFEQRAQLSRRARELGHLFQSPSEARVIL